jgi:RNA polymerase sigma-70 factor (ECF subfamily)
MSSASDTDLVEALSCGGEEAFLHLYDAHCLTVYRFLMHMTGSAAIAEELTQEVFVAILDSMCNGSIERFDPEKGTLEGYLLGIARNLARAERRKAQRSVSLESMMDSPAWKTAVNRLLFRDGQDITTLIAARSDLSMLHRSIVDLPEHYREVIVLCGLQEKSYRDAALVLGCSEGTIASRMNRAKALLSAKIRRSRLGPEAAANRERKGETNIGTPVSAHES